MIRPFRLRAILDRTVLRRFFLNTLIVVLLPFVLLAVTDRNLNTTLSNAAIRSERRALSLAISHLDEDVRQLQQFTLNLGRTNNLTLFSYQFEPLDAHSRFYAFRTMCGLRQLGEVNSLLYNTAIYFPRSGRIISGAGMYTAEDYYSLFIPDPEMDLAAWTDRWFGGWHDMDCALITSSVGVGYARGQVHLLHSVPFSGSEECAFVVDLVLDQGPIVRSLEEIRSEGAAYICNREGDVLVVSGDAQAYPFPEEASGLQEGVTFDKVINGESVTVIGDVSPATGWQYILVVPSSILTGDIDRAQRLETALRWVSIATAVLCAVIITAINYRPIGRLTQVALRYGPQGETMPARMNEIDLIHHNIESAYMQNRALTLQQDRILEKYNQILQTESQNRNLLLDSLILRLIRGSVPDWQTMESWLMTSGVSLPYASFCVALVHISQYGEADEDSIPPEKKQSIISMIGMMFRDICETIGCSYSAPYARDTIAYLINTDSDEAEVISVLDKTRSALLEGNSILLSIGLGSLQRSLVDIQLSNQEAQIALEYRFVKGKGLLIAQGDIPKDDRTPISLSDDYVNQIDAALLRNNEEQLERLLESLRDEYPLENMSMFKAQSLYYSVINIMMNTLAKTNIDIRQVFGEDFDPLDSMASCETISEVIEQMEDILRGICSYKADIPSGRSARLAGEAMELIRENFFRSEFSQQWVADRLNVSSAYLSRCVKQETGRNMIDIINILRVEKARSYLLETDLPLAEIADRIGFGSTKSLMRIFRQYVGMTPGQLREKDRLENSPEKGEEHKDG